jgi:hypothetical protein
MLRIASSGTPTWRSRVLLLSTLAGLAGCAPPPPPETGEAPPDPNCGIFYDCGSHSDTNQGGNQTATGSSSDDSTSSSTSTAETTGD